MSQRVPVVLSTSLAFAALGTSVLAYAHWVERARLEFDRYTVRIDKPGLPSEGVTILHLSDFHFRAVDRVQSARLERLRRQLAGQSYDILALTGDLIHDEAGLPTALAFLSELRPRIAAFTVPGNRDYYQSSFRAVLGTTEERARLDAAGKAKLIACRVWGLIRMFARNERARLGVHANNVTAQHQALEQQGIETLVNRSVHLQRGSTDLVIAGVDDLSHGKPDVAAALKGAATERPLVLLTHNPDVWLDPRAAKADLVLAGHTHGGQVRFAGFGALYRQGTHLPSAQPAGWFERGASTLFVTRGMGESFPFRLGAPPQAALIRLIPVW